MKRELRVVYKDIDGSLLSEDIVDVESLAILHKNGNISISLEGETIKIFVSRTFDIVIDRHRELILVNNGGAS